MTEQRKDRIESVAVVFATITRHKQRLAAIFNVTPACIGAWVKTELFTETLDDLGYQGNRRLELQKNRDVTREAARQLTEAKAVYQEAIGRGIPKHERVDYTARRTRLEKQRVYRWAKRFYWEEQPDDA